MRIPGAHIATVIHAAATDGTDGLRYFVGVDNPPLIKARREMSEEDYIWFVRATYYRREMILRWNGSRPSLPLVPFFLLEISRAPSDHDRK